MVKQCIILSLLFIVTLCTGAKKQDVSNQASGEVVEIESTKEEMKEDSIYRTPHSTARLENIKQFYAENSKFKNWSAANAKVVMVRCISWKDGTTSDAEILRSSGADELDNEAIRLVHIMKLISAKNAEGEPVNSYFTIPVSFP